jgi:hypothetical protein
MISYGQQSTIFQDLTLNATPANVTRGEYLMNMEHRYLMQKFFGNEGSYSISTIGNETLSLTAAPNVGDVTATLAVTWAFPTCTTVVTFSDGEVRNGNFLNGSTAVKWQVPLIGTQFNLTTSPAVNATSATLQTTWATTTQTTLTAFSDGSTQNVTFTKGSTAISWATPLVEAVNAYVNTSVMTTSVGIGGVQFYRLPPNYSKLKDLTLTVGNLKWTLDEVRTREDWDKLNVFPYYASIPKNYYIYPGGDKGGMIGIWPIPSSTGNTISFNYKFRVPDLSMADYVTETVSVSNGSSTITGAGTTWTPTTNSQLEARWIQIAQPTGDNLWYQIASVDTTGSLTLYQPYQGIPVSGGSYTLGQMPLIAEDFQDMLVWKALQYYYSSIVDKPEKAKEYKDIYDNKLALLSEYSGTNTVNVNLSRRPYRGNPNLYNQNFG